MAPAPEKIDHASSRTPSSGTLRALTLRARRGYHEYPTYSIHRFAAFGVNAIISAKTPLENGRKPRTITATINLWFRGAAVIGLPLFPSRSQRYNYRYWPNAANDVSIGTATGG
jgi:hypothetical protein